MKCLLCNFKSNEKLEDENHYLNFHNVDKTNIFFQRLLKRTMKRTMFFMEEDA